MGTPERNKGKTNVQRKILCPSVRERRRTSTAVGKLSQTTTNNPKHIYESNKS